MRVHKSSLLLQSFLLQVYKHNTPYVCDMHFYEAVTTGVKRGGIKEQINKKCILTSS